MMVTANRVEIHLRCRAAITVIEVLFAMLVAIVGILGIATVLPLAARNAKESNSFNFVHSAADSWYQEFSTRGMNDYSSWKALQDYRVGTSNPAFVPMVHAPLETPTYSTVTAQGINRIWAHQAICLDPFFFTDPIVNAEIASAVTSASNPFSANVGAFRPAVFPYYQDGHNPITDGFSPSSPWPDQPRMVRVTLDAPMLPMSNLRQVNRAYAEGLFTASDDFASFVDEKQSDIPATRIFNTLSSTGPPSFVKAVSERKYSWLATLSPREPLPSLITATTDSEIQEQYTLSIVIFQGRDMSWVDPTNPSAGSAENKPGGERLVWVYPLSGDFTGGNGGRVRLITNAAVEDRLTIGDWIMLGKHYAVDPSNPANRYAYFRWYRIVAVDAETQRGRLDVDRDNDGVGEIVNNLMDPFGNGASIEVWSRDVVLEGPDWSFAGGFPTSGTLMKNVITVIDRETIIP